MTGKPKCNNMKKILLALIRFYKKNISPLCPSACKFFPTCSVYAMTAIERFGALKGGWMALCRLLRCNPFSKGGYDPVPEILDDNLRKE